MFEVFPVGGHLGGECYLLVNERCSILADAGFDFSAETTAENIRAILGKRSLDYILASHAHYDHISGLARLRRHFPTLQAVGSQQARELLRKEKVRDLMASLNGAYAMDSGIAVGEDRIHELALDIGLEDGETLALPGTTIRAVATPGHTRCSMSYYFPKEELLICSETLGIAPCYPNVIPCFIVGYGMTLDAIDRSRALRPKHVMVPHYGLVPDGDVYFTNARRAAEEAVNLLLDLHGRGCTEEEIIAAFSERYYAPAADMQPERAFILNTRALIPRILQELRNNKTA